MQLKSFQVRKFRNIVDSGVIEVDHQVTSLVGKNEAGKSGLLEALYLFNPAHDEVPNVEEQYPRWLVVQDRRLEDLASAQPITVTLELEESDLDPVREVFGDGVVTGKTVVVSRRYDNSTTWSFDWAEETAVANLVADFPAGIQGNFTTYLTFQALHDQLGGLEADDENGPTTADLADAADRISDLGLNDDASIWHRIVSLLKPMLPKFFRFTNYSTLPGRIDFRELASGADSTPGRSDLQAARALLKLAGAELDQLTSDTYELRRAELEAVQIDLTNQVFEYWKQNPDLEVLIDVDKETVTNANNTTAVSRFLDIRLRDKRTGYSNNFSQRSSGFQWFFSFLAAFSEFDDQEYPIVLLDEPALTLHGRAQADFLRFINERLAPGAPVLYTTHSPFMIEVDKLERVRIVEDHGPPRGATATSEVLTADSDSLFPLQAALGYDIAQSLFVGPNNLLVEGTSDFIYLTIMSQLCTASGRAVLDERWRILPAGGATNIPTFVSLIGPHLDITVLADSDTKGMQRVSNMVERGLLKGHRLVLANVATNSPKADLEDLFSDGDYVSLYNKTYGSSVRVGDLPPGDRIVKRLEALNGDFIHGEVAETLLRDQFTHSFTATTLDRFAVLNDALNATIET